MKVSFTLIYRSESNQCYIRSICLNTSSLYLFQRSIPAPICSSKSFHRQDGWFHYEHSHIRAWSPDRRIRLGFVVAHAPGASPWGRTSQPTATSSSTAAAGPSRSARSSRAASSSKAASPPRTASLSNTKQVHPEYEVQSVNIAAKGFEILNSKRSCKFMVSWSFQAGTEKRVGSV